MKIVKYLSIAYYIGMALLFAGIIMKLNDIYSGTYFMAAGVAPLLAARIYNVALGNQENRRLNSILLISSLVLALSVVSIFLGYNFWILGIFVTAILDLYVSFRKFK